MAEQSPQDAPEFCSQQEIQDTMDAMANSLCSVPLPPLSHQTQLLGEAKHPNGQQSPREGWKSDQQQECALPTMCVPSVVSLPPLRAP